MIETTLATLESDLLRELGEPDYKLARMSHGTEPWHYWCRESIVSACQKVSALAGGPSQSVAFEVSTVIELSEEDIFTLHVAIENLRSPDKSNPRVADSAWRTASKLADLVKRATTQLTPIKTDD